MLDTLESLFFMIQFLLHIMDEVDSPSCISDDDVREGDARTWRLFLGGLLDAHADADVSALFASFGITVVSIDRFGPYKERIFYRRDKRVRARYERRMAFITCRVAGEKDSALIVEKATRLLHGTRWKGTTLRCQFARPRGIDVIREEIRLDRKEEELQNAQKSAEGSGHVSKPLPIFQGDFRRGSHRGVENTVIRFEDDDSDDGPRLMDSLWDIIETPKQAVYNYEKHLEMCQEKYQEPPSRGDEDKKISVVEAFLQQQDAARSKRREERKQALVASYQTSVQMYTHGETPLAVVDFASDDDGVDRGMSTMVQNTGIDLSRFDDSDDDGKGVIPQVDGACDSSSDDQQSDTSTISSATSSDSLSSKTSDSSSPESSELEEDETRLQDSLAAEVFPGGASFHAQDETAQAQAQATLGVHSERIRTSLKQYRKRARRI